MVKIKITKRARKAILKARSQGIRIIKFKRKTTPKVRKMPGSFGFFV